MGKQKDDRSEEEKEQWNKGKFDDPEVEAQREQGEREAGNPLAPPE